MTRPNKEFREIPGTHEAWTLWGDSFSWLETSSSHPPDDWIGTKKRIWWRIYRETDPDEIQRNKEYREWR